MPEPDTTLEKLGWNSSLQESFDSLPGKNLIPGRIAVEDKHHYIALTRRGDFTAQITGKVLHESKNPAALPKVGDWVALSIVENEGKAQIHHILPRRTKLSRKAPGREIEEQVLVTNIDLAFVVQALDQSFNPALIQRHLLMAFESGARPIVVLNKIDLCADLDAKVAEAEKCASNAPIVTVCGVTGKGIERLSAFIQPSETVVFIGSSGVGKSTLTNQLYGEEIQATADVREKDAKGRHMTTWRELIILPSGGLVIDTPGMREFHIWLAGEGMHEAFPDLEELAVKCHFRNCTHLIEKRCAVLEALASGQIPRERYDNFLKLHRELQFLEDAQRKPSYARGVRKKSYRPKRSK
jgi:ribosome biogenesis GTPase